MTTSNDPNANPVVAQIEAHIDAIESAAAAIASTAGAAELDVDQLRRIQRLLLATQGRIGELSGAVASRISEQRDTVQLITHQTHAVCGHTTTLHAYTVAAQLNEPPGSVRERTIAGYNRCQDCWAEHAKSGDPYTPDEREAVRQYRDFSEAMYCAGWMSDPRLRRDQFMEYLTEGSDSAVPQQLADYEEEHLPLLVECIREARRTRSTRAAGRP